MHFIGDDAEEGEVYDGSDQDEPDSDPNLNSEMSPRLAARFGYSSFPMGSRAHMRPSLQSFPSKFDQPQRPGPPPQGFVTGPPPDYPVRILRNIPEIPRYPAQPPSLNLKTPKDPSRFVEGSSQTTQTNEFDFSQLKSSIASHAPKLPSMPPRPPAPPTITNGPPPFPFPRPQLPGLPNPPTVVGSQEEIEQMHLMYRKARELYERAVAKVNAAGLNLKLTEPPEPPPAAILFPQPKPTRPSPVVTNPPKSMPPPFAPPPPAKPQPPKAANAPAPSVAPQPEAALPPVSVLSADASTYSLAYAAAYKQTVSTIPTPENGGPQPNTPEHVALWQRFMDYYLRYYMQAYASMASNGTLKPETIPLPTGKQPIQGSAKALVSTAVGEDKAESLEAEDQKEEKKPSTPKRLKLPEEPLSGENTKPEGDKKVEKSEEKDSTAAPASNDVARPADDIKSSKCIWIANLPQGVKAVDVKERCSPYGRVQTIKIIGSRKSNPPSIYAYLVMESVEAAARLAEGMQGEKFDNQEIKVKRINALPIP